MDSLRSRNKMGTSDSSLNLLGILRWGHLEQSPMKSWFCTLFFQLAVMSWTVPRLSLSLGCKKQCCRCLLEALWSAIKLPVIIVSPHKPLKTHSTHVQTLWAPWKDLFFSDFSRLLAYSKAWSASRFLSYSVPILRPQGSVELAELFQ